MTFGCYILKLINNVLHKNDDISLDKPKFHLPIFDLSYIQDLIHKIFDSRRTTRHNN